MSGGQSNDAASDHLGVGWGRGVFGVCFRLETAGLRSELIYTGLIGYFGACERFIGFIAIRWT